MKKLNGSSCAMVKEVLVVAIEFCKDKTLINDITISFCLYTYRIKGGWPGQKHGPWKCFEKLHMAFPGKTSILGSLRAVIEALSQ